MLIAFAVLASSDASASTSRRMMADVAAPTSISAGASSCSTDFTVLRNLTKGAVGAGYLVRMAGGRVAVLKAYNEMNGKKGAPEFAQEAALQKVAAAASLAPQVLRVCEPQRQIFSDFLDQGWLNASLEAALCPPDSLGRSAPRGLAAHCSEFSRLLAKMDTRGLLQTDWDMRHVMRQGSEGALKVIDYSQGALFNASLRAGANWCVFNSIAWIRAWHKRPGTNGSYGLPRYAPTNPWMASGNGFGERCMQRCMLHAREGVLPPDDGPLLLGNASAEAMSAFRTAHLRSCPQIMHRVATELSRVLRSSDQILCGVGRGFPKYARRCSWTYKLWYLGLRSFPDRRE